MRSQENDGIPISTICRMRYHAHHNWRVSALRHKRMMFEFSLKNIFIAFFFRLMQKSNGVDNNTLFGTRRDCWFVPSGLCVHTRSVSDGFAFRWRRWVLSTGEIGCNGNAVCCTGSAANISLECRDGVRHFRCIRLHSMFALTIRNKRLGSGYLVGRENALVSNSVIAVGAFN